MPNMEESKYIHEPEVHNVRAAKEVVPMLIKWFNPNSVIDVGCGLGTWLSVFKDQGVGFVQGVDANYVDRSLLLISEDEFYVADLDQHLELKKNMIW